MDWKDAKAKLLEDPELRKAYEKRDWSFELMKLWLDPRFSKLLERLLVG